MLGKTIRDFKDTFDGLEEAHFRHRSSDKQAKNEETPSLEDPEQAIPYQNTSETQSQEEVSKSTQEDQNEESNKKERGS